MGFIESNALTAKILSTTNNFSEKKIFRRIHLFSQNIRLLQYEADSLKCSTHDIFQTYLRLKDIIGSTAIFKHFRRVQRYKNRYVHFQSKSKTSSFGIFNIVFVLIFSSSTQHIIIFRCNMYAVSFVHWSVYLYRNRTNTHPANVHIIEEKTNTTCMQRQFQALNWFICVRLRFLFWAHQYCDFCLLVIFHKHYLPLLMLHRLDG